MRSAILLSATLIAHAIRPGTPDEHYMFFSVAIVICITADVAELFKKLFK